MKRSILLVFGVLGVLFVGVLLGSITFQIANAQGKAPIQKWEYLGFVAIREGAGPTKAVTCQFVGYQCINNYDIMASTVPTELGRQGVFAKALDSLGNDGWEFVGTGKVTIIMVKDAGELPVIEGMIFRRPK